MLVCVSSTGICTRDRECSAHPVFPAPSVFSGGANVSENLGRIAPRESFCCSIKFESACKVPLLPSPPLRGGRGEGSAYYCFPRRVAGIVLLFENVNREAAVNVMARSEAIAAHSTVIARLDRATQ